MKQKEFNFFIGGILLTLFILTLIILTYKFSNFLIEYAGVTTFYSLIFLICLFLLKERIDRNHEANSQISIISRIKYMCNLIEENLDFYSESFLGKNPSIPIHSMNYFDFDSILLTLNHQIKGISTKSIIDKMFFINDKIDTLNFVRENIVEIKNSYKIKKDANKKIREFYEEIYDQIETAIKELRKALNELKELLERWKL